MPSVTAAVAAKRAGYKNVFTFMGGYPEWRSKGYEIEK